MIKIHQGLLEPEVGCGCISRGPGTRTFLVGEAWVKNIWVVSGSDHSSCVRLDTLCQCPHL